MTCVPMLPTLVCKRRDHLLHFVQIMLINAPMLQGGMTHSRSDTGQQRTHWLTPKYASPDFRFVHYAPVGIEERPPLAFAQCGLSARDRLRHSEETLDTSTKRMKKKRTTHRSVRRGHSRAFGYISLFCVAAGSVRRYLPTRWYVRCSSCRRDGCHQRSINRLATPQRPASFAKGIARMTDFGRTVRQL